MHSYLDDLLVIGWCLVAGRFIGRAILVLAIQQLTDRLQVALKLPLVSCSNPHPVQDHHPAGQHTKYAKCADDKDSRGRLKIWILVYLGEIIVGLVGVPATIVMQVRPVLLAGIRLIAAIPTMVEAIAVEANGYAVIVPAQKLRANIAI